MTTAADRDRLRGLLGPVVDLAGFDLEDVAVTPAGRRRVVRVVVDRDGGVGLDAIAEVSRPVSEALDAEDARRPLFGGAPYTLEVTSPGVDRPLTEPRHWRRAADRLVTATLRMGDGPGRSVTGRVVTADDETLTWEVEGTRATVPLRELGPGTVQVEFRRRNAGDDTDAEGDE